MAMTNDGTAIMLTDSTAITRSARVPLLMAARQPSGMPSRAAQPIPAAIRASVNGICSATVISTERWVRTSVPRSPVTDAAEEARDLDQDGLIQAHFHTKGFAQFRSGERP